MQKMIQKTMACGVVVTVIFFAGISQLAASETMQPKKDQEMVMKSEGEKMMSEGASMQPQGEATMTDEELKMKKTGEMQKSEKMMEEKTMMPAEGQTKE